MFLIFSDSERQSVEVYSVNLALTPNVEEVPASRPVLFNYQARKRLWHIAINSYKHQEIQHNDYGYYYISEYAKVIGSIPWECVN